MNSINEVVNYLVSVGLWIGAAVLVLVLVAAFKLGPRKQPPGDDPPQQ